MNRKKTPSWPVREEVRIDKHFDNFAGDDSFAFAEVACYLLAMLSILDALILLAGASPYSLAPGISVEQGPIVLTAALIFEIFSVVVYYALARRLSSCSMLVWRVTLGIFLLNLIWSAQLMTVKPGPLPMLLGILSLGGVISVVRGRKSIQGPNVAAAKPGV
ncbi:hypothetical protein PAN31117_03356 [Pandoraea anapnoica]|uniref:Uncharacterized protein n=1 Tax=Pandoraea anapnoica TaxID=2508301 RepID=A0A5E5A7C0_9BURK|nr:hypothetical protein [Pandoraea anapnoica]VVE69519.1 hypothetical protein PAN31117_03356 [Pandoraea anapnoica]